MDEFDAILNLESEWEEEGRKEGREDGKRQGIAQGRELGLEKGHELAHELGYYAGCAEAWMRLYHAQTTGAGAGGGKDEKDVGPDKSTGHVDGAKEEQGEAAKPSGQEDKKESAGATAGGKTEVKTISERTMKNLKVIVELVDTFPVDDLTDEGLTDRIDKIRAKFKVVVSQLGMVPQMQPEALSF